MILIVGCGFLGSYLAKHALKKTDEPVLATVRSLEGLCPIKGVEYIECDIQKNEDLARLRESCVEESLTVFYLAACHNIDYICENSETAYSINVTALENFISFFPNIRKLFFASTDCVYGENSKEGEKFSEASALNPVNEYGRQKILAEKIVHSHGFTVFRYPFMLGPSLTGRKHFYDNICDKLKNGEEIEMIDGMYRSVLSYAQAAEYTLALSRFEKLPNTVNICSDSLMSKYDIGIMLAKKLGAKTELVKKITEKEGQKFFKDKRASCTSMDNSLLKSLLGKEKIKWEEK